MIIKQKKGFTLIELLVVIAIIAILAAAIFVAVNPARRFAETRNARRWTAVNSILNAVLNYVVDNAGDMPSSATAIDSNYSQVQIIGDGGIVCSAVTCSGKTVASSGCFTTGLDTDIEGKYIQKIPEDPSTGSSANTRYYINKTSDGRIEVGACDEESVEGVTPIIEVGR